VAKVTSQVKHQIGVLVTGTRNWNEWKEGGRGGFSEQGKARAVGPKENIQKETVLCMCGALIPRLREKKKEFQF